MLFLRRQEAGRPQRWYRDEPRVWDISERDVTGDGRKGPEGGRRERQSCVVLMVVLT